MNDHFHGNINCDKSKCGLFNKTFTDVNELKKHVNNHVGVKKPYLCQDCGKQTTIAQLLIAHYKRMHAGAGNSQAVFICAQCTW